MMRDFHHTDGRWLKMLLYTYTLKGTSLYVGLNALNVQNLVRKHCPEIEEEKAISSEAYNRSHIDPSINLKGSSVWISGQVLNFKVRRLSEASKQEKTREARDEVWGKEVWNTAILHPVWFTAWMGNRQWLQAAQPLPLTHRLIPIQAFYQMKTIRPWHRTILFLQFLFLHLFMPPFIFSRSPIITYSKWLAFFLHAYDFRLSTILAIKGAIFYLSKIETISNN